MTKKKEEILEEKPEVVEEDNEKEFEFPEELLEKRYVQSTGFRNIDTNITLVECDEETGDTIKVNRGILSGSIMTFTGVSGGGKSTLAFQITTNLMRKYIRKKDTRVKCHIFDIEQGMSRSRFKNITNLTDREIYNHFKWETDVSLDNLHAFLRKTIDNKKESKEYVEEINTMGKKIKTYPPTFVVVDAMSEIVSKDYMDGDKRTNMDDAQRFRELATFFRRYLYPLVEYNINLICVSHLSENIETSMFDKATRQWKAMPAKYKIGGGKALLYATSIGIWIKRIVANSPDAVEKKASYLKDNAYAIMEGVLFKNRQGQEDNSIFLVSDNDGFNPMKSFLYECSENKLIYASGSRRKIVNWEEVYTSSNLIKNFIENPDLRTHLFDEYDKLKSYVFEANKKTNEDRKKALDILDMMMIED